MVMKEVDYTKKRYLAVVQCDLVKQRCSGFRCESSFYHRKGGFEKFPAAIQYRTLYTTCGGCCGRALHRKLSHLIRTAKKVEQITRDQVLVIFSSCITKDNFHGPQCPHLDYLKVLVGKLGLDLSLDTHISKKAEERRNQGIYEK
jgi:predicted metal-binding protein